MGGLCVLALFAGCGQDTAPTDGTASGELLWDQPEGAPCHYSSYGLWECQTGLLCLPILGGNGTCQRPCSMRGRFLNEWGGPRDNAKVWVEIDQDRTIPEFTDAYGNLSAYDLACGTWTIEASDYYTHPDMLLMDGSPRISVTLVLGDDNDLGDITTERATIHNDGDDCSHWAADAICQPGSVARCQRAFFGMNSTVAVEPCGEGSSCQVDLCQDGAACCRDD